MECKTEYNSTSTNSYNCYSNVYNYGSIPNKFPTSIINPTPATIRPQLFWRIKPHTVSRQNFNVNNCFIQTSCPPYLTLNLK